jgi:hypothetical protein
MTHKKSDKSKEILFILHALSAFIFLFATQFDMHVQQFLSVLWIRVGFHADPDPACFGQYPTDPAI